MRKKRKQNKNYNINCGNKIITNTKISNNIVNKTQKFESETYIPVQRIFSLCGDRTTCKCNRMQQSLEHRVQYHHRVTEKAWQESGKKSRSAKYENDHG